LDAAGVWGTECGEGGRVVYHKEPIRSSFFVKKEFWQSQIRKLRTNLLLVHARATSKGGGVASINENNHPFVSADNRIGMVHNGTLEEINFLKDRYQTLSTTDSEVLLRMYEHGLERDPLELDTADDIAARMAGIKDIWSVISQGAMSVALGERVDDHVRYLFLFRNFKRPLWIADLRDLLGQVFFFSSPDIWYSAIASTPTLKRVATSAQKLIEIPADQVWVFRIDETHPMISGPDQIERFEIQTRSTGQEWQAGELYEIPVPKVQLEVITPTTKPKLPALIPPRNWELDNRISVSEDDSVHCYDDEDNDDTDVVGNEDPYGLSLFEMKHNAHEEVCNQIIDLTQSIQTLVSNTKLEGTLSATDYENILESLEQTRVDLEGTLHLAGG
jgi:hypothetical protein